MRTEVEEEVQYDWLNDAACKGMDPQMFYIDTRRSMNQPETRYAISVCKACPVVKRCLEENIHEQYGIWGGKTAEERQKMRARMGAGLRCVMCDKKFSSLTLQARYCSQACRSEARRVSAKKFDLKRAQVK